MTMTRRLNKRLRKSNVQPASNSPQVAPVLPCLIIKLPLELLAEILIYTSSPRDVLAIARCNKFLCATLVLPSSAFIWRGVRNAYPVPPPPPMSIFTESSYAAFLFDDGPCENCGASTDVFYRSFALRLRLCKNAFCVDELIINGALANPKVRQYESDRDDDARLSACEAVEKVLLSVEAHGCLGPRYAEMMVRGPDWNVELAKASVNPENYIAENERRVAFKKAYIEFCQTLYDWKQLHEGSARSNKLANYTFMIEILVKNGWHHQDLLYCSPYGALHRLKNKRVENVTQADYNQIESEVNAVLLVLAAKRACRKKEVANQALRNEVQREYTRIRSQKRDITVPPLSSFRQLPVMQQLSVSVDAAKFKKNSQVSLQLEAQLKDWKEGAQNNLSAVLGYPNWKQSSSTILHPVERVTARFLCKSCSKLAVRYREDRCFDFTGACQHECLLTKKEKQMKIPWSANTFTKDEKAITVLTKLLCLCGLDASLPEAAAIIDSLGATIVCMTCEPGLVMDSKCIIGHSHRHDEMQIKLISKSEGDQLSKYQLRHGTVQKLTCSRKHAEALQDKKCYGCRHCAFRVRLMEEAATPSGQLWRTSPGESDQTKEDKRKGGVSQEWGKHVTRRQQSFKSEQRTFDGLRSHLKAKHGIEDIRDEDLFIYDSECLESWLEDAGSYVT